MYEVHQIERTGPEVKEYWWTAADALRGAQALANCYGCRFLVFYPCAPRCAVAVEPEGA